MYNIYSGVNLYALVDVEIRQNYLPAVCCSWLDETKLLVGYASGSIKLWNIQNQGHKGKRHNDCQNLEICPKKVH